MSITSVGSNKTYASINDLPENSNIADGDRFIVQTLDGDTVMVDYSSIKVDLDHTTFGAQFTEIVSFTSYATTWVDQVTAEFETIQEQFVTVKQTVENMQQTIDALTVIIKLMIGYRNSYAQDSINDWVRNQLGSYALTVYSQIMENADPTFTFAQNNLLRIY